VAPVWLHSEFRIDALGFCFYLALLVHALIERQCRRSMTRQDIHALPLYPEDRSSTAPTATRLLDQFTDLAVPGSPQANASSRPSHPSSTLYNRR
jgi:hypothetical protein